MARIRSVHPDLFLDEAFVSLKISTRVFLIGLWTECDDHGAFEWQPSRLRFKILPADGIAGDELLGELERANIVKKVDIDGRSYGLVRNFCRFQRPKKPTFKVEIPREHWNFVAMTADGSLPSHHHITGLTQEVNDSGNNGTPSVPHRSPTKPEKSALKKEEGGREKGKEEPKSNIESLERVAPTEAKEPSAPPPGSLSEVSPSVLKKPSGLVGVGLGAELPELWTPDEELFAEVIEKFGMTEADVKAETYAFHAHHAAAGSFSANWRASFVTWCKRWREHRDKQVAPRLQLSNSGPRRPEKFDEAEWDKVAAFYAKTARWTRDSGPDPMSPSCMCPKAILAKHGIDLETGERRIPAKAVSA